jgi:drug/metabolite transporter (DMT)-like permease
MNSKAISWSIFILLCFIWGSSFILMKTSAARLSVSQIAALRIFSASVVFIPSALIYLSKVPRKKLLPISVAGIFGNLVPAFFFAAAITKIDSSLAGILNSLTPICVAVIGITLFKDKIGALKIIGILIGFAGVCLLTFTQNSISLENLGYASLVLLGTISYGINVNTVSHYLKGLKPMHVTAISLAILAVPTAFILWYKDFFRLDFHDPEIQWSVTASVMLGLAGSAIATALFYILVQKAGGLFASLVTYGIPFVALFWGVIDGEKVTAIEILCLAIILSGVYLANRTEKPKKE